MSLVLAIVLLLVPQATAPGALWGQSPEESPLRRETGVAFRVLSWNVSGSQFFAKTDGFRAIFRFTDPDLLVLDEVQGGRSAEEIAPVLRGIRSNVDTVWNVVVGAGGGYQRGAIISRYPIKPVSELNRVVPYPDSALAQLKSLVPDSIWNRTKSNLDAGIAVAGAIVQMGTRAVLAVAVDLQCCNGVPDWQEFRRQIEVREIRSAIQAVLRNQRIDAVLVAGDFNLVSSGTPLVMITNPYPAPHRALVPVDALQLDGTEAWTWDGRGRPFPSRPLDFSLYSPNSLEPLRAVVLSTEDLSPRVLSTYGLEAGTSRALSAHLPIIVDYRWRSDR